jgi:membrane protein insertase Oxa1/YidC/SpoIIIJ
MTAINEKYKTINKYNKRAANANKMHKLNHAGYLLILLSMLPDKIRKKFEFKAGEFEVTTLTTLLISFLQLEYKTSRVNQFFFQMALTIRVFYHKEVNV